MKDLKIFAAPSITFIQMTSKDVISVSDDAPKAVFDNQLDIWDEYGA